MDIKIIFNLHGNVLIAFSIIFFVPVFYAVEVMHEPDTAKIFLLTGFLTAFVGAFFVFSGKNHRRRLPAVEAALSMIFIYPLLSAIGLVPILFFDKINLIDAALDTVSNFTSSGISILPIDSPYILKLWQSLEMWFGALIFLVLTVTVMPEVGGCFGLSLSLTQGQSFSPMFGQMNNMAKRVIKIYCGMTLLSFALFNAAGLNFWDSLLMSMRCISTGGGNFFPGRENIYVQYAAAFSMLAACLNILLLYRIIFSLRPPKTNKESKTWADVANYIRRIKNNLAAKAKIFFTDSEVRTLLATIFVCVGFIFLHSLLRHPSADANRVFRYAFFHVTSFISTTGFHLTSIEHSHDFDRFMVFVTALLGGCIGSVTGGLKIIRFLILWKSAGSELEKTMHPNMITSIRINKNPVSPEIVGRVLGFFFMAAVTLFVCSALLSVVRPAFSTAVAISVACLTNTGVLPGICEPSTFLYLTNFDKFLCAVMMVAGRLEIFALLIAVAGFVAGKGVQKW